MRWLNLVSVFFFLRELDEVAFEKLSNETLEELAEFFENLGDSGWLSEDYDISLAVSGYWHNQRILIKLYHCIPVGKGLNFILLCNHLAWVSQFYHTFYI